MFFARLSRFSKTVGFKLTAWSAAVFAISSLVLFILTYLLLSSSLKEKDRQAIQLKLKSYAQVYEAGGLPAFTHRIETERNSGELHNQILKFTDSGQATLAFVPPDDGTQYDLRPLSTANGNPSSSDRCTVVAVKLDNINLGRYVLECRESKTHITKEVIEN